MAANPSSGLGVVALDLDLDGWMDLYVANDLQRNFQWHNLRDGTFEEIAMLSGSGVSMLGRAQASMGVVASDLDNDGDEDLFMTHLTTDTNALYVNDGQGRFADRSTASGLAAPSLRWTGFGVAAFDLQNDGWLDVYVANGAVKSIESQAREGVALPLEELSQLFVNRGDGTFDEASSHAGEEFRRLGIGRGVATGDLDNDGSEDLVVMHNNGPVRILLNRYGDDPSSDAGNWLGLRIVIAPPGEQTRPRDALGARVAVERADVPTLWRRVATDGSYLSASDPRLLIGLGDSEHRPTVVVHWLDGRVERWANLEINRYHELVAGAGDGGAR
jgi:ribosomal protein S18 acetylase RimI-like enzyme